jgi:hypothetical protein
MINRFGKYFLLEKIGTGGMAEIFKATYASEEPGMLAIKRILPQFCADRKLISMLINEAKISISLNHPNIVPIFDFGLVDNQYFLAMMFVEGKDLRAIMQTALARGQQIPLPAALYIGREILAGLDYAHNRRDQYNNPLEIVHRDVSPANIILSPDGTVRILDFGIAKVAAQIGETQAGVLKGKFSYMSPEQAKGQSLDRRSDLFSVGVLLHEMLALTNLFLRENEIKTLQAVRRDKVPRLSDKRDDIPREMERILDRALQKKRRKRYSDAAEFQADLDQLFAEMKLDGRAVVRQLLLDLFPRYTHAAAEPQPAIALEGEVRAGRQRPARRAEPSYRPRPGQARSPFWTYLGVATGLLVLFTLLLLFFAAREKRAGRLLTLSDAESRFFPRQTNILEKQLAELAQPLLRQRGQLFGLSVSPALAKALEQMPFEQADRLRLKMAEITENYTCPEHLPVKEGAQVIPCALAVGRNKIVYDKGPDGVVRFDGLR